jgi:methionyl-tRNA formyltransferase
MALAPADKVSSVDGINSHETIKILKEISPDAIIVYGTTLVKDSVLSLARDVCFNLHTGISPYYRGTACTFWPVVNGEFDMLGATVHECTSFVDGGKIFEVVRAQYKAGDDLHTIFGRAVVVGTEALIRVIGRYQAGQLAGMPQDLNLGREYRGSDLTLGPEIKARVRLAQTKIAANRQRRKSMT